MQTNPKHRKNQPRGCPTRGTPGHPTRLRGFGAGGGVLAGGPVCCTEGPVGKGWKLQTSCGKNLLIPGLA